MDIFEFNLRYDAYHGLKTRLIQERDQETIVQLVKVSNRGTPDKAIQELSPDELKGITIETYSEYKTNFISEHQDTKYNKRSISKYIERLEYELKIIKEMGFITYFLIVSDFIKRSKENTIVVGPGRGSGAGSLLARCLKITDVDPLEYDLLFERFLNPSRISMPDFDIDFEDANREKVIEYVKQKYGNEQVGYIGTYMKMASKAAFKDSARVLGIAFDRANMFSNLIPDRIKLKDALQDQSSYPDLVNMYNSDEKIKEATELGLTLEGNTRQLGVHACGIIIAPQEISHYAPIQYAPHDINTRVTQYDGPTLEYIGLLKMDFLGLRNLSVIKNCIKIIAKVAEKKGEKLADIFQQFFMESSFEPPLNDTYTYEKIFHTGDTTGIFQFEGGGMRRFLVQLKADNINDLVAMNALYRPGPMEFIPSYIKRKHGDEKISYMQDELAQILIEKYGEQVKEEEREKLEDDLKSILSNTYGIAVYQEQLMFLVQNMAGFSLSEADLLRRGIGKKKKEIIDQMKKEFIEKGEKYRGYKPETTQRVYEKMIEPAGSYSFNKSHSVCYALIAYQTAYLKAYYPVPFYAALIRSVQEDTDSMSHFIAETQQHGIEVKPTDINESFNNVAAIEDYIRLGFISVRGIGYDVGEFIQKERSNGLFTSLEDFLKRCSDIINKKSLEGLIKSGALDAFQDRKTLLNNTNTLIERSKNSQNSGGGLFSDSQISSSITFSNIEKTSHMKKLMMEQEAFKTFVGGHPLDGLYEYIKKYGFLSTVLQETYKGPFIIVAYIKNITRAKKKGFFIQIEDITGITELFVKDILDLKKYDIIYLYGNKNERISIDKIIKTNRERLLQEAKSANKYNPENTVIKVKTIRLSAESPLEQSDKTPQDEQEQVLEQDEIEEQEDETSEPKDQNEESENNDFPLPNSLDKIRQIAEIIKTHPGDITIILDKKSYIVNQEGLDKIRSIIYEQS